jgi:hypothetical protein
MGVIAIFDRNREFTQTVTSRGMAAASIGSFSRNKIGEASISRPIDV